MILTYPSADYPYASHLIHVTATDCTVNGEPAPTRLALMDELREWQLDINAKREAERKRIAEGR